MSSEKPIKLSAADTAKLPQARVLFDAEKNPIPFIATLGVVVLGWLVILYINRWHFGAPVFFLFVGWLSVILIARYLWAAGMSAAIDGTEDDEEFWKPVGRRHELMIEKRALLKAIKEIDFDHQMGKMSDDDAAQMTRLYRSRAIAVIKALDTMGKQNAGDQSISDRIENEVKARLTVAQAEAKSKAAKKRKSEAKSSEAKSSEAKSSEAKSSEAESSEAKKPDTENSKAQKDQAESSEAQKDQAETASAEAQS